MFQGSEDSDVITNTADLSLGIEKEALRRENEHRARTQLLNSRVSVYWKLGKFFFFLIILTNNNKSFLVIPARKLILTFPFINNN